MRTDMNTGASLNLRRVALQIVVVALGLVAIVGSGGGALGFPDMSCLNQPGSCPIPPSPPEAYADIGPSLVTTQVGSTVVFSVQSTVIDPSYRWCRLPAGDANCTEIVGATAATYMLVGASLSDDGTGFGVRVTGSNGTAWATSRVAVSSMPGVTFQDGEFLDDDWAVTTIVVPSQNGPTANVSRAAEGGNPGAFRTAEYQLPVVPSSVRVFYSALSALYDPAVQGAIYLIDFAEDCIHGTSSNLLSYTGPMIEQAGRRFVAAKWAMYCRATTWTTVPRPSLGSDDFELVDGPACAAGESCPNFSSRGAAIRLGLVGGVDLDKGAGLIPPVQPSHGFDNWKVTVWRR
jgi:hypothetical protein